MSKLISLKESVQLINDCDVVAFGGNVLHRSPNRVAKEISLQGKKNLHLVKTAVAYEIDLLCAVNALEKVTVGFVGYESEFGLCKNYRNSVENGSLKVDENACYTIITGLRASAYGVPFLPVRGMLGSDLIDTIGFKLVKDPYSGEELAAIKQIRPNIAFIHVQEADIYGNARIIGPKYEDIIIAKASEKVVVTCEKIIDSDIFLKNPESADLSSVFVDYVVELPNGAKPGSCPEYYDIDKNEINMFKSTKAEDMIKYIDKSLEAEYGI